MIDEVRIANPYITDRPITDSRHFFGRDDLFAWLNRHIRSSDPLHPLLLFGPSKIGKTSVLRQIEDGRFQLQAVTPIYIDLATLSVDSLSIFLWEVTQATIAYLDGQGIDTPHLAKSEFVADPYSGFSQGFLEPIALTLSGHRPFFLFDNLDAIIQRKQDETAVQSMISTLFKLIQHGNQGLTLFTLRDDSQEDEPLQAELIGRAHYFRLGPLTQTAALRLIRQSTQQIIVKDVADYLYNLTQGYPHQLQSICHEMFVWQQQHQLKLVTVADLAHLQQQHLRQGAAVRLQTDNGTLQQFKIKATPAQIQPMRKRPLDDNRRQQLLIFGLIGLVLISAAILVLSARLNQSPGGLVQIMAGNTTATAAATAVPVISIVEITSTPDPALLITPSPTATVPSPTITATPSATNTPGPTATSDRLPARIIREADAMPMILIPAAQFEMGSEEDDVLAGDDERPKHTIFVDAFYIDQFEVSVAQYAAFLNRIGRYQRACNNVDCASPRSFAGYTSYLVEEVFGEERRYLPFTGFDDYPMNHVSWYGAVDYCTSVGGRLPTEAEWEYAARGTDGRIYPWGNEAPDQTRAVFQSVDFVEDFKAVDALPAGRSPFGIYGMAGSLWEWVHDWYDQSYYSESPPRNPTGPEIGIARVIRGGGWPNDNRADRIRAANRSSLTPDFISSTVGFRCARTP